MTEEPISWEGWDEYFWDDEWVVQASSLGAIEERPIHVTAQFMTYKPTIISEYFRKRQLVEEPA